MEQSVKPESVWSNLRWASFSSGGRRMLIPRIGWQNEAPRALEVCERSTPTRLLAWKPQVEAPLRTQALMPVGDTGHESLGAGCAQPPGHTFHRLDGGSHLPGGRVK